MAFFPSHLAYNGARLLPGRAGSNCINVAPFSRVREANEIFRAPCSRQLFRERIFIPTSRRRDTRSSRSFPPSCGEIAIEEYQLTPGTVKFARFVAGLLNIVLRTDARCYRGVSRRAYSDPRANRIEILGAERAPGYGLRNLLRRRGAAVVL